MPEKPDSTNPKPGPDPERLVITEDPATALDKLLKKPIPSPKKNN